MPTFIIIMEKQTNSKQVVEIYDFDSNDKPRFKYLQFYEGKGMIKSHGYSYLHCRKIEKMIGNVMGLEKKLNSLNKPKTK